jgi:hypothetical protein
MVGPAVLVGGIALVGCHGAVLSFGTDGTGAESDASTKLLTIVGTSEAGRPHAKIDMLSDFEHDSLGFNASAKWNGGWMFDGDKTPGARGTLKLQTLAPPRPNGDGSESAHACEFTANGQHLVWGAVWYAMLLINRPFDASGYTGITFWARSDGPATTIKLSLPDIASWANIVPTEGEVCDLDDSSDMGRGCFDHYAVNVVPDGTWKHYDVPFAMLRTEGFGLAHPYDPSKLMAIMFSVPPEVACDGWIDDVAFYVE